MTTNQHTAGTHTVRTLDTATVLSHASATVRKLTGTGNARFTFTADDTPRGDWRKGYQTLADGMVMRKPSATEARAADSKGPTVITPEQAAAESLRPLRTSAQAFNGGKGFTAPTGKTVTPIGAWVTVDGRTGQVWSEGSTTGTVWVAMTDGDYVETSRAQVTDEPVADVLPLEVPTVDVDAARDLAARAEATGRDGVAFVRQAMGDTAADALAAQDRPAPLEYAHALVASHSPAQDPCDLPAWASTDTPVPTVIGYTSQVGPMRSNATCVHCGQASGEEPSRDVRAYVMAGASWDAVECVGAHCTACADVDAAQWYMRTAECQVQREAHDHALPIGPAAPPQVMHVVQACTPDVFAQRMHALRRRHLRLQAWRLATA